MIGGLPFAPKPRPCKSCGKPFVPARPMQGVCGLRCAVSQGKQEKAEERARIKTRKDAVKTIPVRIAEAQAAFNSFVRMRDAHQPCISCGASLHAEAVGGGFDCGHYRSRGSAPHLRFDERNAHGQCKRCNRYGSGMVTEYRIGLMDRIGQRALDELERDQHVHKWTHDELRAIKAEYVGKLKELKKERL